MEINPYYEAAVNKMAIQVNYLQELIGRELTPEEKDNLHEFYIGLDLETQYAFESACGQLI